MHMKVAVCDDEPVYRLYLREILARESLVRNLEIEVTEYAGGEALLEAYTRDPLSMDIVLLDILMPGMDGMETAKALRKRGAGCVIVFLTSLEDFARQGYEVRAFRYILKEEADRALGPVLLEAAEEFGPEEYFSFTCDYCTHKVGIKDILYFESRKRLVILQTVKASFSFYQKLDILEEQLSDKGFLRCHRSFLVREKCVRSWKENALWLEDGTELPISRTYEKQVNRRLMLGKG